MREGMIVRVGTPRELTTTDLDVEIRYRRDGEEVVVSTTEPTRVLHELTTEALARGEELERPRGAPPDARRRLPDAHRRRRGMSLRLFVHQLRSEQLLFWRSKEAALFIFLFPLLLFVLLGSVYSGTIYGVLHRRRCSAG